MGTTANKVSPASILQVELKYYGKSLINNRNVSGFITDPWGTPTNSRIENDI